MKQSSARPAGKLNATHRWQNPKSRILDLDDDILLPADPRPALRQPAPAFAPPPASAPAAARPASQANPGSRPPQVHPSSSDAKAIQNDPHRMTALLASAGD